METLNVTIDGDSVMNQKLAMDAQAKAERENKAPFKKFEYDPKKYLDTLLPMGMHTKTIKIRLLPFKPSGGSPFELIHIHSVKVNKELSASGWKKFICPTKMSTMHSACPFCELSKKAREKRLTPGIPKEEAKAYSDIEFVNKAKDYWLVRCIDRANPQDGPKFWRFAHSKKADGVYDKILALYNTRMQDEINIFDLNCGRDLVITISKDNNDKIVYQVADASRDSALSDDYNTAISWIQDPTTWDDIYPIKPYDYLEVVAKGGFPVYDKNIGKFISKEDAEAIQKEAEEARIKENLTPDTADFSKFVTTSNVITKTEQVLTNGSNTITPNYAQKESVVFTAAPNDVMDDEDSLPF